MRSRAFKRSPRSDWTRPTIHDVYAQLCVAYAMLKRIQDNGLADIAEAMDMLLEMIQQLTMEEQTHANG